MSQGQAHSCLSSLHERVSTVISRVDASLPYVFIFPLILFILLLFLYPLYAAVALSLYNREGVFVGLGNYQKLLADKYFWHALKVTLIYVALYTAGVFFVGFVTALFLQNLEKAQVKARGIISAIFTLPYAIPDVCAALVWAWIFDYQYGVMNYILGIFGLSKVMWFNNPSIALYSVLLIDIWRLFPLHTLIIWAGFRTIPKELYEAAELDGAGGIRKFFNISLPLITRVFSLLLVLTIVWSFKRFTVLWITTGGGPARATETLPIQIYRYAFKFFNKNWASTIGTVALIFVSIIIVIYLFQQRHRLFKEGS